LAGIAMRNGASLPAFNVNLTNPLVRRVHALGFFGAPLRLLTSADEARGRSWEVERPGQHALAPVRPLEVMVPLSSSPNDIAYGAKWSNLLVRITIRGEAFPNAVWYVPTSGLVRGLEVDRLGQLLLVRYEGATVELRRTADGGLVQRYEHGPSGLTCAQFSPDGRAIVTGAEDGSLRVWPVDIAGLARGHVPVPRELWSREFPEYAESQ
jgi:WD40 repeat protein